MASFAALGGRVKKAVKDRAAASYGNQQKQANQANQGDDKGKKRSMQPADQAIDQLAKKTRKYISGKS